MGVRIKKLSPVVANQIAAGEVIERPASVVKELLENALDAASDNIHIDIGHGGLNYIKISDNGCGIIPEDLPLAIAAHATSKISQLDDLYSLDSMGFRGEALASIASIAKLIITSKTADAHHATRLETVAGKLSLSPSPRTTGTTIEAIDLFYNAPVRKKFLKSDRLEFLAIESIVKRFALSAPQVAIQLTHDGKTILQLPSVTCIQSRLQRISKIFGSAFIKEAVYFEVDHGVMQLNGWVSGEGCQRSQNDRQWVYINQRMVKDKLLQHAIKQAYEGILHPGRFPACLLFFSLDTREVDVNVHPTKHEVRFQQPRLVHDFFTTQLNQVLKPQQSIIIKKPIINDELAVYELKEPIPIFQHKQSSHWIVLNSRYGIAFRGLKPYLVDIKIAQQHCIQQQLVLPLSSRPLLVPISYPLENLDRSHWHTVKNALINYGITLDIDNNQLIIRTVPIILPQLDIRRFLSALLLKNWQNNIKNISEYQFFDAGQLSTGEKNHLYFYLEQLNFASTLFCKELTEDNCKQWLKSFA